MINVIKENLSPIFYILLFILVTVVALYFSFTFSYYLLLLSLPLLAFTIYALNGFIDTLKSDYEREVEKKEKEMFEKLSQDDAKEYIKNNPNSKIALDEQRRREKDEEEEYISKKISSVYEPKLIKTINVKSIILKNIFNVYVKTGLPVFFDSKDTKHDITQKIEEVRFTNQEISCFEWMNNEGVLLTLEEIKEQLRLRENRAINKTSIRFNMSTESLNRRWFKIYNKFCFYERPSSQGMIRLSSVFTGTLDNKIYENGQLKS